MSTNKEDHDTPEDTQEEEDLSEDDLEEAAGGVVPGDDGCIQYSDDDEIDPLSPPTV